MAFVWGTSFSQIIFLPQCYNFQIQFHWDFHTFQPTLCTKNALWALTETLLSHTVGGRWMNEKCVRLTLKRVLVFTDTHHTHTPSAQDTQCPFIVFVWTGTVCSVYRSSASSSSSSEPEGPWRTSSYHLLVRVFIWIRPCNRSCQAHGNHTAAQQHTCKNERTYSNIVDTITQNLIWWIP